MIIGEEIVCLSYFQAKPQFREALIKELLQLVKPTLNEPGCLIYELLIDESDPNFLIMSEKFANKEALEFHEKQDYIVQFVAGPMAYMCERVTWNIARKLANE